MPSVPPGFFQRNQFFLALLYFLQCHHAISQSINNPKKRINIIVSSKSDVFDGANFSFQMQSRLNHIFNGRHYYFLVVKSLDDASKRICRILEKENGLIGNMWFDSHGHMGRRVSLVEIGRNEINYLTIKEPENAEAIAAIGRYCDYNTVVALGSCYSGATFTIPAMDKFPEQRMNGDSLMISMSRLLNCAIILGTESWVMAKPGIYNQGDALAGGPLNKRFKDVIFLPSWKKLGEWVSYSSKDGVFRRIRTVSMDKQANICINFQNYLAGEGAEKKQMRIIAKLKTGKFNPSYFYRFEYPPGHTQNPIVKKQPEKTSTSTLETE